MLGAGEAVGYEAWLRAYTAGAAFAGGQKGERGTLAPGTRADLVVLAGALDAEHPPQVDETWVAGERRYARRPEGRTSSGQDDGPSAG